MIEGGAGLREGKEGGRYLEGVVLCPWAWVSMGSPFFPPALSPAE